MNTYLALKNKHQEEVNQFPIEFAFNNGQFKEVLQKLGLKPTDTHKVYKIGMGGFIRKSDAKSWCEMVERHEKEREEAVAADETGDGYIFEMFNYELGNHEYSYTRDAEPALSALGVRYEDIEKSEQLKHGFEKARKAQFEE